MFTLYLISFDFLLIIHTVFDIFKLLQKIFCSYFEASNACTLAVKKAICILHIVNMFKISKYVIDDIVFERINVLNKILGNQ